MPQNAHLAIGEAREAVCMYVCTCICRCLGALIEVSLNYPHLIVNSTLYLPHNGCD